MFWRNTISNTYSGESCYLWRTPVHCRWRPRIADLMAPAISAPVGQAYGAQWAIIALPHTQHWAQKNTSYRLSDEIHSLRHDYAVAPASEPAALISHFSDTNPPDVSADVLAADSTHTSRGRRLAKGHEIGVGHQNDPPAVVPEPQSIITPATRARDRSLCSPPEADSITPTRSEYAGTYR